MYIPSMLLKQLYTRGSLNRQVDSISFTLKNRVSDATLDEILSVTVDGREISTEKISLRVGMQSDISAKQLSEGETINFALGESIDIFLNIDEPDNSEQHKIDIAFKATPFGKQKIEIEDKVSVARAC